MNKKDRENFKRDKIRQLWMYGNLTAQGIADALNADPEFKRKCGSIAVPTVVWWINKKIKPEMENLMEGDAIDRFVAEFIRTYEFFEGEIEACSNMLKSPNLKEDDRIRIMNMRHRFKVDQATLLADRELPLTVKKYKRDRAEQSKKLIKVDEPKELDVKWPEDSQV